MTNEPAGQGAAPVPPSKSKRGAWLWLAFVVGLVVFGLTYAKRQSQTDLDRQYLSGSDLTEFVSGVLKSCDVPNSPLRQRMTAKQLTTYCTCTANRLAATQVRGVIKNIVAKPNDYVDVLRKVGIECLEKI